MAILTLPLINARLMLDKTGAELGHVEIQKEYLFEVVLMDHLSPIVIYIVHMYLMDNEHRQQGPHQDID